MAGRCELVKSVIQGMAVYTMMIYSWPKQLLYNLQLSIINFIWTGDLQKRSLVIVQWKALCKPLEEQSLGIRIIFEFNLAGMIKLAWDFLQRKRIWCAFVRARYYSSDIPIKYHRLSYVWKGIKEGLQYVSQDIQVVFGKQSKSKLWYGNWYHGERLIDMEIPENLEFSRQHTVADLWNRVNGGSTKFS